MEDLFGAELAEAFDRVLAYPTPERVCDLVALAGFSAELEYVDDDEYFTDVVQVVATGRDGRRAPVFIQGTHQDTGEVRSNWM